MGVVKNSWYGEILAGAGRSIREGHLSCDVIICRPNASPLQLSATNDYQLLLTTPVIYQEIDNLCSCVTQKTLSLGNKSSHSSKVCNNSERTTGLTQLILERFPYYPVLNRTGDRFASPEKFVPATDLVRI